MLLNQEMTRILNRKIGLVSISSFESQTFERADIEVKIAEYLHWVETNWLKT